MKKLIITLDDYGLSRAVDQGINYVGHHSKLPTGISLMVWGRDVNYAINHFNFSNVDLGQHLELFKFEELGRPVKSEDYMRLFATKSNQFMIDLVKREIEQFENLVNKKPAFINSHKGIHGNYKVLEYLLQYCADNNIPIRRGEVGFDVELGAENYAANIMIKRSGIRRPDFLVAHILGNDADTIKNDILQDLSQIDDGQSVEILFHPGFFDKEVLKITSLNYQRSRDIEILCDQSFMKQIQDMGFKLTRFKDL